MRLKSHVNCRYSYSKILKDFTQKKLKYRNEMNYNEEIEIQLNFSKFFIFILNYPIEK